MRYRLRSAVLALFLASAAASFASAASFFDTDEPAALKKPVQKTERTYMIGNAPVPPRRGAYEAPAYEPRTPIYGPVPPKAGADRQPAVKKTAPQPYMGGARHVLHGDPDSKIYHAYDCRHYGSKSATAEFATAKEAEKAGYRPCRICEGKEGAASAKRRQIRDRQEPKRAMLSGNPATKYLHGPSCKYYDRKTASESFSSVEAARKAGYRLCTICEGK